MFERFTDRARRVVVLAQEEARRLNHNYIGTEHILLGLIQEGEGHAAKALEELNINIDSVRSEVVEIIGEGQQSPSGHIPFTPRAKKVLELSLREALQLGHNYIGTEHILLGLIREGEGVAAQVLKKLGAELSQVRQTVIKLISSAGESKKQQAASTGGRERPGSGTGSAILDQFGRNLTRMAKEGKLDPVIGRTTEIERVMQILSRRTKNNPVLIGEPGVGKTAIVEGLAQKIVSGDVPVTLEGKLFLGSEVNDGIANSLVAQMLYLDSEDSSKPIYLYINSPGGSVTAGLAIYDTIQYVKSEVVTICVGLAASMGAFLLAAGTKGKRVALPHSRIMIHQPLGGTSRRQASDIEIEAREILRMKEMLNRSLADMSGQSFEKIEKDTDRDYFLSAEEAKEYGLIDRVISHPNEA